MNNFSTVMIDADKIKELLIKNNITLRDLANKIDKSAPTIYNYFHRGNIRVKTANRMAQALGVDINDIIKK